MLLSRWIVSRSRLDAAESRSQKAQDEVRLMRAQLEDLRAERDAALRDAAESRAMVADWLAEQMFGKRIYNSSAPALPEQSKSLVNLPSSGKISARQYVRQAEADFFKQFEERTGTADDLTLSATT